MTPKTREGTAAVRLRSTAETSQTGWLDVGTEIPERYARDLIKKDQEIIGRRITNDINKNPSEADLLRRSLRQAKAGKTMPWRDSDDDT